MPFYAKLDIYQILERKDGAIWKTKKVAYHWYQVGTGPELNSTVPAEVIEQNGLPPGEYVYCSTLDTVIDSRIPAGGRYKQ